MKISRFHLFCTLSLALTLGTFMGSAWPNSMSPSPGAPVPGDAQPLAMSQSDVKYKGIWEPVNYSADVKLLDTIFVTAQEGWVSGGADEIRGGIILHTADGGSHWDVQYGDPQSSDRAIRNLRFLDTTHGWAMQGTGSAVPPRARPGAR